MLNFKQYPRLFDKKPHINETLSQSYQYLVKVKDHKFHIIDRFQEEIKVLEL
jgi:hypothetical protein